MRSERLYVKMQCNQACTYCDSRWGRDDEAVVGAAPLAERIADAAARGVDELVLTGGEPGLRRDLTGLVAAIRGAGVPAVVLETNATLISPARAAKLAAAGLTGARVNLSGWGAALDAVTRDPGGCARTLAGLRGLLDAGLRVQVAVAVVRSTAEALAALPAHLAAAVGPERLGDGGLEALWVNVPVRSPDATELLPLAAVARAVARLDRAARSVGLPLRLNPEAALRPCMLEPVARYAHLFSMTPGGARLPGFELVAACASCLLADRCLGLPVATLARVGPAPLPPLPPLPPMTPVTSERVRRRVSLKTTVREQMALEFVTRDERRDPTGGRQREHIIRINFACNQACGFCFVSTHLPGMGDAAVRAAIAEACRDGARITFSGGEPTLNPRLLDYVRLARAGSAATLELQTNATRLGDPLQVEALVAAGVDEVLVSLHGSHAALSDAITEAPGTFEQTVAGLDALHGRVGKLTLHFVICEANHADLLPWVRWVAQRWPRSYVNFSFVALVTDVVPRDRALLPRYSEVLPNLERALSEAERLGLHVGAFHSMCGIPLCIAPKTVASYLPLADVDPTLGAGEFVHPAACEGCRLLSKCFGVRQGYVALYGAGELAPVA